MQQAAGIVPTDCRPCGRVQPSKGASRRGSRGGSRVWEGSSGPLNFLSWEGSPRTMRSVPEVLPWEKSSGAEDILLMGVP